MAGVALVTGAGTGIGKYSALALSAAGFKVVLCGRRLEPLQQVATKSKGDVIAIPADVSDPDQVDELFARTQQDFGRLDVLFNNAGGAAPPVPIDQLTFEQWQIVVDANLTGTFLCTRQAFGIMKAQHPIGGRIINNGSISAHTPRPNSAPYTATKHAISGLTRSTSLDGRAHDIACGQIDIGNALTDMTARMAGGVAQANGSIAVEPTMDVNDIGRAIIYMAGLPLGANVLFMTVMASNMPFVGRG